MPFLADPPGTQIESAPHVAGPHGVPPLPPDFVRREESEDRLESSPARCAGPHDASSANTMVRRIFAGLSRSSSLSVLDYDGRGMMKPSAASIDCVFTILLIAGCGGGDGNDGGGAADPVSTAEANEVCSEFSDHAAECGWGGNINQADWNCGDAAVVWRADVFRLRATRSCPVSMMYSERTPPSAWSVL
jgi:hypothetical protein